MTLLIIAGHHRSGTSLLGQLLSKSGLFLGDRLLGATAANPYGHFEDLEVVELHDRILHSHGLTWQVDRPFIPTVPQDIQRDIASFIERREAEHELWGFKDPRVCLFLPLWKHHAPDAKIVITARHPSAVSNSLERRAVAEMLERRGDHEMAKRFWQEPDHGLRLWHNYNAALRRCMAAYPEDCMVTTFAQMGDGRRIPFEINRRWQLGLAERESEDVFDQTVVTSQQAAIATDNRDLAEIVNGLWSDMIVAADAQYQKGA